MKKTVKALALITALVLLVTVAFTSCGKEKNAANNVKKVGIIQFMPHASLDNCTQGIKDALDKAGIAYDIQVGTAASPVDDCNSYAQNMVASGNYDLIIAVATPAATAAYSAVRSASADIPVIFSAVSAPVEAGLVQSLENPVNNCTGTKDAFDIVSQLAIIKALQPSIKTLGVFYTTTESNSLAQLKLLEDEASKLGIEVKSSGINDQNELAAAVASLLPQVEAVTNLTDNTVVENMATLLEQAKAAKIPVYGSEIEQCRKGCIASASLDYVALGVTTGEMAVSVLNGAKAGETAVVTVDASTPVFNTEVVAELGLTIPDTYKDAETVTTTEAA